MSDALTEGWIRDRVQLEQYVITRHGEEERRNDDLAIEQIEEALMGGVILEDYPTDARGPSCLVAGRADDRHVHVVCGRNTDDWLVIITVYIPAMPKWRGPTERNCP